MDLFVAHRGVDVLVCSLFLVQMDLFVPHCGLNVLVDCMVHWQFHSPVIAFVQEGRLTA